MKEIEENKKIKIILIAIISILVILLGIEAFFILKDTKTIKVSKAKITSAQLKKLKKKTRYKVRIRAVYTKAGYQTATSKWSAIKTVKTK